MKPQEIIQELKTKHLRELTLGLKFKAKGKLSEEARALMKVNEPVLIDHLVVEAYQADTRRKYLAELGMTPLNLDDIRLAIKAIDKGDSVMRCYFGRWINNPTLYQGKLIECLEVARKGQQITNKDGDPKASKVTTSKEAA